MRIKRIFALFISIILFIGNTMTALANEMDLFSLFGVMPMSADVFYTDQELTAYRGAETEIILTYNNKTDSWLAPTMVSWDNPTTNDTYFVYCADPTYAGYMDGGSTSNNYTLDIKYLEDTTRLGSGTSTQVDYVDGVKIQNALEGAVNYGYPSRDARDIFEDVVGVGASVIDSVSQDQLNYAAYLATKVVIWSIVSTNHTITMWETSSGSGTYSAAFKEATLQVAHDIYYKALAYVRPTYDPDSVKFEFEEPVLSGDEYIIEATIVDNDGLGNGADVRVFMNDGTTFASNDITVDGGRLSADGLMYYVPSSDTLTFRMKKPTEDEYDITKDVGIFLTSDYRKQLVYGDSNSSTNKQSYILAGNAYIERSDTFNVNHKETGTSTSTGLKVYKWQTNTDENGARIPLEGVVFQLYNSAGQMINSDITDTDGTILWENLELGTYTVKEVYNNGLTYTLTPPTVQIITLDKEDDPKEVHFYNDAPRSFRPHKVDAETGVGLEGVQIAIKQIDGEGAFTEVQETDSDGYATFSDLPNGTYMAWEVSTIEGYILDPTPQIFVIANGQSPSLKFLNSKIPSLNITKQDAVSGELLTGVATFRIEQIDGTYSVDVNTENGIATIPSLPVGSYTLTELQAPEGYVLDSTPISFYVAEDESKQLVVKNYKTPELTIQKIDGQSGNAVEGTIFEVRHADGTIIGNFTTGADGTVTVGLGTDGSPYLAEGTYTVTEVFVPEPYVLDSTPQNVQLQGGDVKSLLFCNLEMPSIKITKYDEESGDRLPNAQFVVYEEENRARPVYEGMTDENGEISTGFIAEGTYVVEELLPPFGYTFSTVTESKRVVVARAGDGEIVLKFDNIKLPTIKIEKYDEDTMERLPNAQFVIYQEENAARPIFEGITDSNGEIYVENLAVGTYVVEEINPPFGYTYSDVTESKRTVVVEGGDDIVLKFDNVKLPELTIKKQDAITKDPIEGVIFEIIETDDTSVQPSTVTTDSNGEIVVPNLEVGTYTVKEISVPSPYILDSTPQNVQMNKGDQKTLLFENTKLPTLVIEKIDGLTYQPIPNTTYKIEWEDENGGVVTIQNGVRTDENGQIVLPYVNVGWYIITETIAAQGYQLPSDPVSRIYLKAGDNSYVALDDSDNNVGGDQTFTIGSGLDYPVVSGQVNYPLNSIVIKKSDAITGEMLQGATFEVIQTSGATSGTNGTTICTVTSDVSGVIVVTGLEAGTYAVKEIQAPTNYLIAETNLQTVNLKADGTSIVEVLFNNYPYGSLLITKVDGVTGEPLANVRFKVTTGDGAAVSSGEFVTDSTGKILIPNLKPDSYVVTELSAPEGYVIDEVPKTIQIGTDGQTYEVNFKNYPQSGLLITKVDGTTNKPLSNATFKVTSSDGQVVGDGTYTTDSNGEIYISNLAVGSYVVTEISAPDGYAVDDTPQTVKVEANGGIYTLFFENYPYSSILISKVDGTNNQPLANAKFKVTTSSGTVVGTASEYTTDSNGEITIPNVEAGSYIVTETAAPSGYAVDTTPQTVEVKNDAKIYKVQFENYPYSGILINKIDGANNQPLANAKFKVTTADGTAVGNANGIYTTDSNGEISIPSLAAGSYIVTETEAPSGYALDTNPRTIEIANDNQIYKITFANYPYGSLLINKIDGVTNQPLANATFKVTKSDGTLVGNANGIYTTDTDGKILVANLEQGSYIVTETNAPTGYTVDNASQSIDVINNDEVYTLTFRNYPNSSLLITKIDGISKEKLSGATFKVTDANGNIVGTNNGEYTTDSNGEILIANLEPKTYKVTEISAPEGYAIDTTPQTIEIGADNKIYTMEFVNYPYSSLLISKIDGISKEKLSGAVFLVTDSDGVIVGENNGQYTTNASGEILIPNLKADTYKVTEISAPDGYVIDSTPQTIKIDETNDIFTLEFINYPHNNLTIKKVDGATELPLKGAEFKVTRQNGEIVNINDNEGIFATDENGSIFIQGLAPDTYTVVETKAPTGYAIDTTPKNIEINADEKKYELTFKNYAYSNLTIHKVDGATELPLKGAEFKVTRQDGTVVNVNNNQGVFTTDENGIIFIENLESTTYTVVETKAPTGYALDTTPKNIEINADNKTYELTFKNYEHSNLTIHKVDGATELPLKGAEFKVTRQDGTVVNVNDNQGVFTTDENGIIFIENLESTTYTVVETKAPTGYALDTTPKNIEINADNKTYELTFKNYAYSNLTINKVDGATNLPLSGAEFKVTRLDGSIVNVNDNDGVFTTNADGIIFLEDLDAGTYEVTETKAPTGYKIDTTSKTIDIKSDNQKYELTFKNYKNGGLLIQKYDADSKAALQGVEFEISTMTGEKLEDENNRTTWITDSSGEIFIQNLAEGYYNVKETKALDGYTIDSVVKTVKVEETETTIVEVPNASQSGLLIIKTDAKTGLPLQGVQFEVRTLDGQFVQNALIDGNQPNTDNYSLAENSGGTYTTNASGQIQISNIATGKYMITEVKALDGYELDPTVHEVTITQGNQAVLRVTNTPLSGLKLTKIDSITKQPIYNVEFMVFDSDNKVVGTFYTDNMGVIDFSSILVEGRYTIRETRPASGYFADDVPRTVEFISGKTTEITWENTPEAGQIQITKLSADDNQMNGLPAGTPLADAIFEVYDWKTGNIVDRFITGGDGRGVSKALPLGRYTVKEVQAPSFYTLNNESIDVTIEFATQIVKLEFTNASANTGVTINKSGPYEVMANQEIVYEVKNVRNDSTIPLSSFYWRDVLPTSVMRATKVMTGTFNQSLRYKVVGTTNKGNYIVIADNMSTTTNNVIGLTSVELGLAQDEYLVNFGFHFGQVNAGFTMVESAKVYGMMLNNGLPNGTQFANRVDVGGMTGSEWVVGNSTWVTTIFRYTNSSLPKTGY